VFAAEDALRTLFPHRYIQTTIQLMCFSFATIAHGFCRFARVKARPSDREVTRFISRRLAATVSVETLFRSPA